MPRVQTAPSCRGPQTGRRAALQINGAYLLVGVHLVIALTDGASSSNDVCSTRIRRSFRELPRLTPVGSPTSAHMVSARANCCSSVTRQPNSCLCHRANMDLRLLARQPRFGGRWVPPMPIEPFLRMGARWTYAVARRSTFLCISTSPTSCASIEKFIAPCHPPRRGSRHF